MATVVYFPTRISWKYIGIDDKYPVLFEESIGAVIAKGNMIERIKAIY